MPMPVSRTDSSTITSRSRRSADRHVTSPRPVGVNFTALPTRLSSTCRSRLRVAARAAPGMPRSTPASSVSALAARRGAEQARRRPRQPAAGRHRRVSSSACPASIFEKSSTSLMIASSAVGRLRIVCRDVALLVGRAACSSSSVGQADDAVHRRADLVADGGEERALGARRLEGEVARALELACLDGKRLRLGGDAIARGLDFPHVGGHLRLRPLALGQIARHHEKAGDLPVRDPQRRRREERREARAVAADVGPLGLVAAARPRARDQGVEAARPPGARARRAAPPRGARSRRDRAARRGAGGRRLPPDDSRARRRPRG